MHEANDQFSLSNPDISRQFYCGLQEPAVYCVSLGLLLGQYETYSRRRNPSPSLATSGCAAPRDESSSSIRASLVNTKLTS